MRKLLSLFSVCTCLCSNAGTDLRLWYTTPATAFEETLVMGNGKTGISIFGGTHTDSIYLNDITLWSGSPKANKNTEAFRFVDTIRDALKGHDFKRADQLQRNIQGNFSESYAPLGTCYFTYPNLADTSAYHRQLSIDDATAEVTFKANGVTYRREYFVSYPDQVIAIRISADKKGALDFDLRFDSKLRHSVSTSANRLTAEGYAPITCEPSYRGDIMNSIIFDPNQGTRFTTLYTIASTDGDKVQNTSSIGVRNATEAVVLLTTATSFNGFDKDPATEGADYRALAAQQLDKASARSYNHIKADHQQDYHRLYNRFSLDLGKTQVADIPTDDRLQRYETGIEDPYLEMLYLQYGRYLLISASRTMGVPANLQGIWNPHIRPPWSSNYTTNINLQENYWMVEKSNLSELHKPLIGFIANASRNGSQAAQEFLGMNGWMLCHNSDIWAMCNPVGDAGNGDPVWANWYMGGTWLATHLWEHYAYTLDTTFLRREAYPIMKGAVDFCLDWVVKDDQGHWITSPSTSPENLYVTNEGYRGATLYGATCDLAMMRELMQQFIQVSEILNEDETYRDRVAAVLAELRPYQIGKKGNLMEWYHDWDDQDPAHRHTTHLFGLFPGSHISPQSTPELAEACRRTLEIRTDESTGWAMGWRINLWARLLDGDHAYRMYRRLLAYVPAKDDGTGRHRRGGTYPNLFDAHPPFQIDGNFGAVSGIIEMLLQSHNGTIRIIPALPDAWKKEGSFRGIKARGNVEVDATWENGRITALALSSPEPGTVQVDVNGELKNITLKKNKKIHVEL